MSWSKLAVRKGGRQVKKMLNRKLNKRGKKIVQCVSVSSQVAVQFDCHLIGTRLVLTLESSFCSTQIAIQNVLIVCFVSPFFSVTGSHEECSTNEHLSQQRFRCSNRFTAQVKKRVKCKLLICQCKVRFLTGNTGVCLLQWPFQSANSLSTTFRLFVCQFAWCDGLQKRGNIQHI